MLWIAVLLILKGHTVEHTVHLVMKGKEGRVGSLISWFAVSFFNLHLCPFASEAMVG